MNKQERILYHQIHPLKLTVDIAADIVCLFYFWEHHLAIALAVILAPPILISGLIMNFADLKKQKNSTFGHYVQKYMGGPAITARILGLFIAIYGAFTHSWFWLIGGHLIIFGAWTYGLLAF